MFQVTIFSGHQGEFRPDKWFYLTLFGSLDLVRPTIARQIIAERQLLRDQAAFQDKPLMSRMMEERERPRGAAKPFFLTLFGSVDIKCPTVAAEFVDCKEMIRSGLLTMEDWERAMADRGRSQPSVASFTVFGGFDECELPSENEEIDSLAVQRHLGIIPESAGKVLEFGIGHRGSERQATVHRALMATA